MRGHSIVIFATILLASRTARAQFAIGSDIEIDPPAVRPDAGAPGNREHDLRLATVGTTVLASWLDNRVDADEEIRFVRLAQDGHPLDTAASAVPSSRSARHVRTAGGGHSFLVAFLYASQFDRGSTTAMGYRIREDGVLDPEAFSIGSAALEFNHGFLDVGAAWDGDAFITAAVEAWSVTATSYSEGRRIPPSGEPTPTAVPDPQSVFAMQSNDTATIYAYDAPDPGSTSSRAFFISVSGVATRVLDVLPRAIGIATRSSEFVVAVPGHTWQFADYGRLLHHTTTPIPNASELPIAAAGSGYVLAWSTRAPTGDWEIRVSR